MANGNNPNFQSGGGVSGWGPGTSGPLGGPTGDIFNETKKGILGSAPGDANFAYRNMLLQAQNQLDMERSQMQYATMAAQSQLGDIANKISQATIARQQAQAASGIAAGAANIAGAQQLAQQANTSLTQVQEGYTNKLRQARAGIANIQRNELAAVAGSDAETAALGKWLAKQPGTPTTSGWFHGTSIDWDKLTKDKNMQQLFKNLDLDINSKGLQDLIDTVFGKWEYRKQSSSPGSDFNTQPYVVP